jgi:prophage regulatory protein
MASGTSTRLIRLPEVKKITGLSRSMIYLLESRNDFPKRVPLTARTVGWPEIEIYEWNANRMAARAKQ